MRTRERGSAATNRAYDRYLKDLRKLPGAAHAHRPRDESSQTPDALIESHLFYVVRVAREYAFTRIPIEDLLSEGNLGLIEAAGRFDARRGTRFITYASWWIRKRILNLIARQMSLIRLPKYKLARLRRLRQAERELTARLGRPPDDEELQRECALSAAEVASLRVAGQGAVSIESVASGDEGPRLEERLGLDAEIADAEEEALDADMASQLHRLLRLLPDNERFVLRHRFGFGAGQEETLETIARRMGVSRERVRQIERQALSRIRRALARESTAAVAPVSLPQRHAASH